MGVLFEKQWHKIALIAVMVYFSLIFTTICLPAMWISYKIPTLEYYLISIVVMFIGGIVFNTVLSIKYNSRKEEIVTVLPILKTFALKLVAYTILFFLMAVLTGNIIVNLYFMLFLMSGGYLWFYTLRGYIWAKKDKEKKIEEEISNSWLGKTLFFGTAMSLLLGYLLLVLDK